MSCCKRSLTVRHRNPAVRLLASLSSILLVWLGGTNVARAQSYIYGVGSPTFTEAENVELGFINLANGNLHLEIPLAAPPQRGSLGLTEKLIYDSRIWRTVGGAWQPTNVANSQGGWRFVTTADLGSVGYNYELEFCDPSGTANNYSNFTWTEPNGTIHYFGISTRSSGSLNCKGPKPSSGNGFGSDSSGFHMFVTNWTDAVVYARDGTQVYPSLVDTNGNSLSKDANGNPVDTLNRTVVTKTVNGNLTYYDVLNAQGSTSRFTVTTTTINASTNFG